VRVISVHEFIAFSPCDRGSTVSQLTRKSIEVSACLPACRGSLPLANYSERQRSVVVGGARPCALIEAAIKLAILRRARVRHSRRTAKNAAPRNVMQRPDATRRDATRRDATRRGGSDQTAPSSEKFAAEELQSELRPVQSNHSGCAVRGVTSNVRISRARSALRPLVSAIR